MGTLAHLTAILKIPGPKVATFGIDLESNLALTAGQLGDMALAGVTQWSGLVNPLNALFPQEVELIGVEAFAYDFGVNPLPPPPNKRVMVLGPVLVNAASPGTRVGTPLPPQCAAVVTFRTELSSRRTRGRVYLPQLVEGDVSAAGVIGSAWLALADLAWPAWVSAIEGSAVPAQTFTHSVVSLQTPTQVNAIIAYRYGQRIDTQRRRLTRSLDII